MSSHDAYSRPGDASEVHRAAGSRVVSAAVGKAPATPLGGPLHRGDLEDLSRAGISAGTAHDAMLRRVDSQTGAEIVGRNGAGNYAGILLPYVWPGEDRIREYRLRRDCPEMESGDDGRLRAKNKYLSPPGRGNMLYFAPGTRAEWLEDVTLPVVLTEGEKKCLALWELAWHAAGDAAERPRWLPVAVSGVWNWRGIVGKVDGPRGERGDQKGPISDLDRVVWSCRDVTIAFDANVQSNENVSIARLSLAKELRRPERGARVFFLDIPVDAGVNGIDDLIGAWGHDRVLELIAARTYDPQQKTTSTRESSIEIDQIPAVRSFSSNGVEFVIDGLIARGSVTMFSGESGHGKSTVALAMADAIAKGRDFAGRTCSPRQVLILDRDNGIDAMQERYNRLGIEDETGLIVWGGWLSREAPGPEEPVVVAWVKKTEPKPVVMMDTLVAFLKGNENSASEVRAFMARLRHLANLGATVIGLHHTGKAEMSQDYRGSSDFKGAVDVGINIRNFGDGELNKVRLRAFKNRFAIDREIILNYSHGQFESDDRALSLTRTVTEQLTEMLRKNPGIKQAEFEELAASSQLGRNRARDYLDHGISVGEIRIVRGQRNAKSYHLIDAPDEAN